MPPQTSGSGTDDQAKVWTTRRLQQWISSHLESQGVDSPRPCAELLLTAVIGCDRMRLYMEPERVASDQERVDNEARCVPDHGNCRITVRWGEMYGSDCECEEREAPQEQVAAHCRLAQVQPG